MTLQQLMGKGGIVLAPGIYDALSGLIATQMGAKTVYLSGASLAYTRFGRSDVGLVSVSEVHDTLAAITDRIETPVIVDADNGFGNALNVQRTVRYFERAGAAAIQLEDQSFPKRCGYLDGKRLISRAEMVGKVKAAPLSSPAPMPALLKGLKPPSIAPKRIVKPARTCCLSRHPSRLTRCAASVTSFVVAFRCLPIWWKAARRRSSPPMIWQRLATALQFSPAVRCGRSRTICRPIMTGC